MSESGTDTPNMMAKAGPEHELLREFEGTFSSVVKLWMGPGDPMVSTGTMVNTVELGGLYLKHAYQGDSTGGPFPAFAGHGFWGFNQTTKQFEGFWVDNASTMMQVETGTVDESGKIWTMFSEMPNPQTGEPMTKKSVITLQDADHHKMEMFFESDGRETKGMEIEYTRKR